MKRHLPLLLTLAGSLFTFSPTLLPSASAQAPNDLIGTNAPHQERNPSQHPELFLGPVTRGRQPAEQPGKTTAAAPVKAAEQRRRAFIAANTLVVVAVNDEQPRRGAKSLSFEDLIGTNAPHQERNPSVHPELWVRGTDGR